MEPPGQDGGPLVELGVLVNRHGVRGEVRLLPHNPDSTLAADARELILIHRDGRHEARRVRGARRHKRFVLLVLEGVDSVEAATALLGCRVAVPRSALPPPAPGEAYHADLLGCAVETTAGAPLGAVAEVLAMPSTDVLVVRGAGGEHLIPLIADVIASLDVAARRIVVVPLPGLLGPDEGAPRADSDPPA